jgi:hypothetical protein
MAKDHELHSPSVFMLLYFALSYITRTALRHFSSTLMVKSSFKKRVFEVVC